MAKARQQYNADERTLAKTDKEFAIENSLIEKIDSIEEGAQVNTIETVKVNGVALEPDENKAVDVSVPLVEDNLFSIDPDSALSANQGRILWENIYNLQSRGRYLSNWNCDTGLPVTNPTDNPYRYKAGDYYIVSVIAPAGGGHNYRPDGNVYIHNQASSVVEDSEVHVNDMYLFDGTNWLLVVSTERPIAIDPSLDITSHNPAENMAITRALNGKQDTISDLESIRTGAAEGATAVQPGDRIDVLSGTSDNITEGVEQLFLRATDRTKLNYLTGVNTGDETWETITRKLGRADATRDGYLSHEDFIAFSEKQGALTAGDNIDITDGVISATYTAGDNIDITNGEISATYTAGTGIDITDGVISNTKVGEWGEIEGTLSNQTDLQTALDGKVNLGDNQIYDNTVVEIGKWEHGQPDDTSGHHVTLDPNGELSTYNVTAAGHNEATLGSGTLELLSHTALGGNETATIDHEKIVANDGTNTNTYEFFGSDRIAKLSDVSGAASGVVSDNPYTSSWDGVTTIAPSKNAVYDKLNAMDTTIAGKQDTLTAGRNITIDNNTINANVDVDIVRVSALSDQEAEDLFTDLHYHIILYNDDIYLYEKTTTMGGDVFTITNHYLSVDTFESVGTSNSTLYKKTLEVSSWGEGHFYMTAGTVNISNVLSTSDTYTTAYTPTQDYNPATKKYVDDGLNSRIVVSSSTPSNPSEGLIWYDTTDDLLKAYDGANWNITGKIYTAGTGINISNQDVITADTTVLATQADVATKANDSAVVHNTGNESVAGVKTFQSSPVVPTPTNDTDASTKKYVDDSVSAATQGAVSDAAYDSTWDGVTTVAPSKNAVYDKLNADLNTKTFYPINDTTDTATVQAIIEWINSGKNAIVRWNGKSYSFSHTESSSGGLSTLYYFNHTYARQDNATIGDLTNDTLWMGYDSRYGYSTLSTYTYNSTYIPRNNTIQYTPTGDYNPSTKKYVDDSISGIVFPTYTGGNGINIDANNEITADTTVVATKTDLTSYFHKTNDDTDDIIEGTKKFVTTSEKNTWNGKQDVLTAGTGISIDTSTDTISATPYTAGTGLTLNNYEFAADTSVLATKADIANLGSFTVVNALPSVDSANEKTIYLLGPSGSGADKYEEWIVTNQPINETFVAEGEPAYYYDPSHLDFSDPTTISYVSSVGSGNKGFNLDDSGTTYGYYTSNYVGPNAGWYQYDNENGTWTFIDSTSIIIPAGGYDLSCGGADTSFDSITISTGTTKTWTKIGETSMDLSNYFDKQNDNSDAIIEGSQNLFLTSSERSILADTSGVNTGDETKSSIQTALGAATSSNSGYLTSTDWSTFNGKADAVDVNTKTFYYTQNAISDNTTTAQEVLDRYLAGKEPIIYYQDMSYYLNIASGGQMTFTRPLYINNGSSSHSIFDRKIVINYSGTTVSSTFASASDIDVLATGYDYSTPYTPQYDGSPATKKYVDDSIVTYTAGTGLALNGTEFSNSGVTSVNGSTGDVTVKTINGTSILGTGDIVTPDTTYTAGTGIDITNNVISADGLQEELTAGNNITIGQVCESDMKGPCPSGFHVPTYTEWMAIYETLTTTFSLDRNADTMITYLKMPKAGFRSFAHGNTGDVGYGGRYWSSSSIDGGQAFYLTFSPSSINIYTQETASASSIRCLKNSPVMPDNSWTTLYDGSSVATGAGVFYNSSLGLISVSGDGTTWYTIQDKNLGATIVYNDGDTLSEANCGKFYQWGNNYGFAGIGGTVTTGNDKVDASGYGPGNYYSGNIFIISSDDWSSVQNENLRGGVSQGTRCYNEISATDTTYTAGTGIAIGGVQSDMKGPAPDGFHVPLNTEWQAVADAYAGLGLSGGDNFRIYLKIPFAGFRDLSSAGVSYQGTYGLYWSSSRYNANYAYYLFFYSTALTPQDIDIPANGFSVRCFKNSPVTPDSSWTTLYDGSSITTGAGIFHNATDGLISISSDGTTWYTIQDKNLGATTVYNDGDTLSEANCGKYYQWGNNYGFAWTGSITTSSTQVDASGYGPGNYYSSSTFIIENEDWSSVQNDNLWGGVSQGTWIGGEGTTIVNTGVTSVNGSTGAVTGLQTTSNLKTSLSDNSDTYYPSQKAVKTAVDTKADDSDVVHLAGAETITGVKTFTANSGTVDGNPAIISPRIRINGQTGNNKFKSQLDIRKGNTKKGYLGYFEENGSNRFEFASEQVSTPFYIGLEPWKQNNLSIALTNQGIWRGGTSDTFSADKVFAVIGDLDKKISSGTTAPSNPTEGQLWYDTTNDVLKSYDGTQWKVVGDGDVKYTDFNWVTKTGASITLDLNSTITPSENFTINAPSTIKNGQSYILRVEQGATAYTMTLGTNITNPYGESLTMSANSVNQYTFLAVGGNLELQPSIQDYIAGTGLALNGTTFSNTGVTSVNGQTGDVTIESGGLQVAPNSPITGIKYIWYGTESDYANLSQYYTDTPGDTEFRCF